MGSFGKPPIMALKGYSEFVRCHRAERAGHYRSELISLLPHNFECGPDGESRAATLDGAEGLFRI
jgi:hypothetical protein